MNSAKLERYGSLFLFPRLVDTATSPKMIEARYPTWCVSIVSLWFLQVFSLSMVPIGVFPPRFLGFPRYSNALAMFQAGRPCSMPVLKGMLLGAKKNGPG